jgi:hypothetical protein
MSHTLHIALDPALAVAPAELAAAWNGRTATTDLGRLEVGAAPPHSFDVGLGMLLLTTGVTIATGVVTSLLTDLLKEQFVKKQTVITEFVQPDGTRVIVIKEK